MEVRLVDRVEGLGIMFTVSSESVYGHLYEVFVNEAGQVTCDCLDRVCRGKAASLLLMLSGNNAGSCKHMRAVIKEFTKRNNE